MSGSVSNGIHFFSHKIGAPVRRLEPVERVIARIRSYVSYLMSEYERLRTR